MDFRNFLDKLKNALGSVADRVLPGDQSSWHPADTPAPTQQQRNVAAAVGGSVGYGPAPQPANNALAQNALKVNNYVQSTGFGPGAVNTPVTQPDFAQGGSMEGPSNNPFMRVINPTLQALGQIPVIGAPVQLGNQANDVADRTRAGQNPNVLLEALQTGVANSPLGQAGQLFGGLANTATQALGLNNGTTDSSANPIFGDTSSFGNQVRDNGLGNTVLTNAFNVLGAAGAAGGKSEGTVKIRTAAAVADDLTTPPAVRTAITNDIKTGKITTDTPVNEPQTGAGAPPKVPQTRIPTRGDKREAGFVTTVKNSPNTPENVAAQVAGDYKQAYNTDTLNAADRNINRLGEDAALHQAINSKDTSTLAQATRLRLQQKTNLQIKEALAQGNQARADALTDRSLDLVETIRKAATENGRANQILAAYNTLTPEGIVRYAQRGLEETGKKLQTPDAQRLTKMANDVMSMPDGPDKSLAQLRMIEEVKRLSPSSGVDKGLTLWKAGLLTGLKGAIGGNTVGNTTNALLRAAAEAPTAGVDVLTSAITGKRGAVFSPRALFSGIKGAGEGLKKGVNVIRTGYDVTDPQSFGSPYDKYDVKKTFFSRSPLGRAAQKYTDTVFNFYAASDRPGYYAELRKSITNQAITEAKNQGLKGAERSAFIKRMEREPNDSILPTAVNEALEATFANKTAVGKGLSRLKGGLAEGGAFGKLAGEIPLPFTGVPSSILTMFKDYTPTGAVGAIIKAARNEGFNENFTQRQWSQAMGKSITGAGLLYLGAKLSQTGSITLAYPTDPKEQALWQQEGKQPFSVKVLGHWRSLNYTGPAMALLGAGAQFQQNSDQGQNPVVAAGGAGLSAAQAALNSSPLQGAQNTLDVLSGSDRTNPSAYINNLSSSIVPTGIKDISNATDSTSRQVDGINPIQAIQSKLPGFRTGLNAKVDQFGNEIQGPTGIGAILDPFRSTDASTTPLTDELQRLQDSGNGIVPTQAESYNKKITLGGEDVTLDPTQLHDYQQKVGGAVSNTWSQLIHTSEYNSLDNGEKSHALQVAKDAVTSAVNATFSKDNNLGDTKKAESLSGLASAALLGDLTPEMLTVNSKDYSRETQLRLMKDSYSVDLAMGNLSAVQAYSQLAAINTAQRELGTPTTAQIAKNYSKDAVTLANMSKPNQAALLSSGLVDQKTIDEANKYKAEVASYKTKTSRKVSVKKGKAPKKLIGTKVKGIKMPKSSFSTVKAKKTKVAKIKLAKVS